LNAYSVSYIRQVELHTAEPLVTDPSTFEVKIPTEKPKSYKWPGSDRNEVELIQGGSEILRFEMHRRINSIWKKKVLNNQWKESIMVPIYKTGDKTERNNDRGI
jgi:hypothetical protein